MMFNLRLMSTLMRSIRRLMMLVIWITWLSHSKFYLKH